MTVLRLKGLPSLAEDLDTAAESFLSYSKSKDLSPQTIQFYSERLTVFTLPIGM